MYKKRGELFWAIASKKNFINLHSTAFVAVFARSFVHAYKFRIFKNPLDKFFLYIWKSRDQLSINISCKFHEHWKQGRLLNRTSHMTNFSPSFSVYKWASTLFTGIVFKFHMQHHHMFHHMFHHIWNIICFSAICDTSQLLA